MTYFAPPRPPIPPPPAHAVFTANRITISNSILSLGFERPSGALVSIRNLKSGDEYLKDRSAEGNPFRFYVDPTTLPAAATDPGWWAGKVEGTMGGRIVDAGSCRLTGSFFRRVDRAGVLRLAYRCASEGLRGEVEVRLGDGDDAADCSLAVRNEGGNSHTVMTAFPHLTGLKLGVSRNSNLSLMLASFGTPGVPAWKDGGGFYGREVGMQWQDVYEPHRSEGFGFIVMDPKLLPKLIRRFAPGGMSALYLPAVALPPGGVYRYPPARIVIHRGSWRVVARKYGDWFRRTFHRRHPPDWLKDMDLFTGPWIPSPSAVSEAQQHPGNGGFTSFAQLPLLYLNDPYDIKEWAQYNDGVRSNPASYGAYMADGVYTFRTDLGGARAMREGVDRLHRIGRRAMFYVAGNSILKNSPVLDGTRIEDWMLMDSPGHAYDIGYPNGFSVCPGYGPWQDHLAAIAKRILVETGADGIRLDELGTFVPCFNPAHHHTSPFDSNQWLRELVRRVRAAMDEVNPNTLLLTESPIDYLHESCDGALQMFSPGRDIDAMRIALPDYAGFAYHPGAVEAARNGWIGGKTTARRVEWPWAHRGVPGRPAGYRPGPGPETRWHELRASFPEAIVDGKCSLEDPVAAASPEWAGRLWKGRRYWLLVGGTDDGSALRGAARVYLPELPPDVKYAFEINAETLQVHDAHLTRSDQGAFVTMSSPLGAVLLPGSHCPPLLTIDPARLDFISGTRNEVTVERFAPWLKTRHGVSVAVRTPGLAPAFSLTLNRRR